MSQARQADQSSDRFISTLTKNTVAMILAGGRGSRLKSLTDWRAKPAVQFGGKFRIIDFPLSNCVNSGIRRINVATQYKAQSLIQHIQRGWGFLRGEFNEYVNIIPAQQRISEEWYKGTADAVYQNIDILREGGAEYVLILAGDHIYKMDYGKMLATHVRSNADMTVACINVPLEDAKGFGVLAVDDTDRVVEFAEKPANPKHMPGDPTKAFASMGIYVFNAKFLYEQLIRDAGESKSSHDFGGDIIPYIIKKYKVQAHRFTDSCVGAQNGNYYWRDVGTIDAYWEANMELTKVIPELNLYDREWPIWTYQEQLPPAKFVFRDEGRTGKATDSLVSGGCLISGSCISNTVLFSDVRVHSYATIEGSVILPKAVINRHVVLNNVVVDRGCVIPEGMQIGVDLALDAERFYVSEKGVVLVTPDMLGQDLYRVV
ncbi:glucose-1-phosphate adenylyltransferase [Methylotenera oryzisoli]|jgi:glucose-1-phosphate adenylyltransferase|uniref:Glucose-1-phosphate adenylyltransferase n=1 Tax=Methylotenera oryzisoli TaxID=2080758 RepID=A0A4Y9VTD3_9PROT|nr:glucose-1-phosphate adenylyltransferase [Methylotenera oryzisoli]TFW71861.1 glucose-1-phosphate adenylyltransferase [Methylotenera oryzisoli]